MSESLKGDPEDQEHKIEVNLSTPNAAELAVDLLNTVSQNSRISEVELSVSSRDGFNTDIFAQQAGASSESKDQEDWGLKGDVSEQKSHDPDPEFVCDHCGEVFDNQAGYASHCRWCDSKDDNKSSNRENANLNPDTWKFKVVSFLYENQSDSPFIPKYISKKFEGTEWERSTKKISGNLANLYKDGLAERQKRNPESGTSPYEYELTELCIEMYEDAEEDAERTYADIDDLETTNSDDEYECEVCGELFSTNSGLGSHRYYKHDITSEDRQAKNEEIKPESDRYRIASSILNSSKKPTASDIESRLEDTEWEKKASLISSELKKMTDDGLVERERRVNQTGMPYEYELTSKGRSDLDEARGSSEKEYEEVIAGK